MIYNINGVNVVKNLLVTKDKNHIVVALPSESLVNHNNGVSFVNPFSGMETMFFLHSFDEKKGVYIFKE